MIKKLMVGICTILFLAVVSCSPQAAEPVTTPIEEDSPSLPETEVENRVIYMEIGTDVQSNHFEHRVANIYSIRVDGSGQELIFSDMDYPWDLGRVYSVSPDGNKIAVSFFEGGRGAYSSLSIIDMNTGQVETAAEFDYTQSENVDLIKQLYGEPVWSLDSTTLAYEVINVPTEPEPGRYYTDWVQLYVLGSGQAEQVIPRIGGMCATKLTFMQPVLFLPDGQLAVVYHAYYSNEKDPYDIYSINEEVYLMDLETADISMIINAKDFEQVEAVQSFSNFKWWDGKIVFELLGDFEEDGDVYAYLPADRKIEAVTSDPDLREQQPDSSKDLLCYVGVPRYGTISYQNPAGDIYIRQGSDLSKVSENSKSSQPLFSPDGNFIAYVEYEYDQNYEYIKGRTIKSYNVGTGQTEEAVFSEQIIELAGWAVLEQEK
ncbi:MAG: hypothetical protein PHN32_03665 [Actinomycetota bacterium]|nr:hypothetical protein [Actinomycetota bacterium]